MSPVIGPLAITAVVISGICLALWQEHRDDRAAEASRKVPATAHGPAVLRAGSHGRPLDDSEAQALAGLEAGLAADAAWERTGAWRGDRPLKRLPLPFAQPGRPTARATHQRRGDTQAK